MIFLICSYQPTCHAAAVSVLWMRCAIAGSPGRSLEIGDVKNDMVIEVKQIRPKMPLNFGSTATSNLPKDNEIIQTSCKKRVREKGIK